MDDLKWFIGILVLLGAAWFALGGPNRPTSNEPFVTGPTGDPDATYSRSFDRNRDGVVDENERIAGELDRVETELEKIAEEIRAAQERAESSPYRGYVTLRRAGARETDPQREYLEIRIDSDFTGAVPLTGWHLESPMTGARATIGKASPLHIAGQVPNQNPVTLSRGNIAYVSTGRSPIGTSFRINQCTGYFEQFQNFSPALPRQCPDPADEPEVVTSGQGAFSDECLDYLDRLPRCSIPVGTAPEGLGAACYPYVTGRINYNVCVELHRSDDGFYKNEWRLFLNYERELWKREREVIKLLDESGKIVDVVNY